MTLSRQDVERIARLAALHLDEAQLPELVRQIAHIIEYVSQLDAAVEPGDQSGGVWLGSDRPQALRADQVERPDLAREPRAFAPAFKEGLFLVPRLTAMEDE